MGFEKVISLFVILLLWGWVFISSAVIVGGALYLGSKSVVLSLVLGGVGGVLGAEYIRRVFGLVQFFGRLVSHREIDGVHKKYKEN